MYILDPIRDSRWDQLVASDPRASVFHQQGWIKALSRTYGYHPLVLTSTPAGRPLSDGIVFCEIKSWVTGSRLVSLPFADHTEPLVGDQFDYSELTEWMQTECFERKWKYVELRPLHSTAQPHSLLPASQSFWIHTLSLAPSVERLFGNLHKNCLQRRIRRAERGQLSYERGLSAVLLDDFYRLLLITRRRHRLPPQPPTWFQNLVACMGPNIEIRLARRDGIPIAAILTLSHRSTVVYKYGCSDERFHQLAGMPFLFWKLIEESKTSGAEEIDFGRTDLENDGLTEFKDRFGSTRRRLTYVRYSQSIQKHSVVAAYLPAIRGLFAVMPDALSSMAGRVLYRHIG